MPPFPKPRFDYTYDVAAQTKALRRYRDTKPGRAIPKKGAGRLLLATWNIANLGVQDRLDDDYRLIAEVVTWFDLVAVQEVNDNLRGIEAIHDRLPKRYQLLFSDASGNQERQAFLFDTARVSRLREIGRLSIPPSATKQIKLPGHDDAVPGLRPRAVPRQLRERRVPLPARERPPLLRLAEEAADIERRVARDLRGRVVGRTSGAATRTPTSRTRSRSATSTCRRRIKGDPIYDALTYRGLEIPAHTSQIGSAIASDSHYDQIAFFPGAAKDRFTGQMNVFDFDNALFADLYERPRPEAVSRLRPVPHLRPPAAVGGVHDHLAELQLRRRQAFEEEAP